MNGPRQVPVRPMGDAALLVDLGDEGAPVFSPARYAAAVIGRRLPGVRDVVAGACTVGVHLDPVAADPADVVPVLRDIAAGITADLVGDEPVPDAGGLVRVRVRYDGADLAEVARLTGMSVADVIERHAAPLYTVAFTGFSPGFGYLDGLDPELRLPRLATPRQRVPAGSVAIAGGRSCVYPVATPGGWRLLGHTETVMFDPDREPPALLSPGVRVRFEPVD